MITSKSKDTYIFDLDGVSDCDFAMTTATVVIFRNLRFMTRK